MQGHDMFLKPILFQDTLYKLTYADDNVIRRQRATATQVFLNVATTKDTKDRTTSRAGKNLKNIEPSIEIVSKQAYNGLNGLQLQSF